MATRKKGNWPRKICHSFLLGNAPPNRDSKDSSLYAWFVKLFWLQYVLYESIFRPPLFNVATFYFGLLKFYNSNTALFISTLLVRLELNRDVCFGCENRLKITTFRLCGGLCLDYERTDCFKPYNNKTMATSPDLCQAISITITPEGLTQANKFWN